MLIAAYLTVFLYLFNVLLGFVFKPNRNGYLGCGLFGYCGSEPPDLGLIKLLGMFNQERGTDSCGLALNDVVTKGVDFNAKFSNFIQAYDFETPKEGDNYTVIGHTRKSTHGLKTEENAHPFEIYNDKNQEAPTLIFAHNGVIKNWIPLCKEYGIDSFPINVDSLGLGSIIAKDKANIKVLKEYKGGAALLFYPVEKKNCLYVWKGASRQYDTSPVEEERPLYYWKVKGKDQIYVSSMKEALFAIGGGGEGNSIYSFETNKLILIQNGKFVNLKPNISVFDRSEVDNDNSTYVSPGSGRYSSASQNSFPSTKVDEKTKEKIEEATRTGNLQLLPEANRLLKPANFMLDTEPLNNIYNTKLHGNKIYFWKGKYWRNGHLAGGCNLGLHVFLDNNGIEEGKPGFKESEKRKYYFINGLLTLTENSYNTLYEEFNKKEGSLCFRKYRELNEDKIKLNTEWLSNYIEPFVHSVGNSYGDCYQNRKMFSGSIIPKFSNKKYTFRNGDLLCWEIVDKTVETNIINGSDFTPAIDCCNRDSSNTEIEREISLSLEIPFAPGVPNEEPVEGKNDDAETAKENREEEHLDLFVDSMNNIQESIDLMKDEVGEETVKNKSYVIITKLRSAWKYLNDWFVEEQYDQSEEEEKELEAEIETLKLSEKNDETKKTLKRSIY